MLTSPTNRAARISISLALATFVAMLQPIPAHASGSVICLMPDPETGHCRLEARWQQTDNGLVTLTITTGGGDVLQKCQRPRRTVADAQEGDAVVDCYGGDSRGWYSAEYDCYFNDNIDHIIELETSESRIIYKEGTRPGDEGTIYMVQCFLEHYTIRAGWIGYELWFLPSPPEGFGGQEDPTAELIVAAFNELQLSGPEIGTAPPASGAGLVGMPVWFWTEVNEQTWGTPEATATAMGVTVTARAEARHIQWHPGDGSTPVTCDAGEPWQPGKNPLDPPCGHTYTAPSRHLPDGRYEVTGVTTWDVTWSVSGGPSDGLGGTVTLDPQSQTTLRINEVQVLVTTE